MPVACGDSPAMLDASGRVLNSVAALPQTHGPGQLPPRLRFSAAPKGRLEQRAIISLTSKLVIPAQAGIPLLNLEFRRYFIIINFVLSAIFLELLLRN